MPLEHTAGRCRARDCDWLTILRGGLCYECSGWIEDQPEETMDWRPERGPVKVHLGGLWKSGKKDMSGEGEGDWW